MMFLNLSNDQRAFAPCLRCLFECLFASDSDGPLQHCFTVTGYGVWDSFVQRRPCECVYTEQKKKKWCRNCFFTQKLLVNFTKK